MKQNFLPASFESFNTCFLAVAFIAFVLCGSGCLTRTQQTARLTQTSFEEPVAQNASRMNINRAGARELEALPGVGKAIAERIINHRTQYGPFRRAEHLLMVRGISDQKFRNLRAFITTE